MSENHSARKPSLSACTDRLGTLLVKLGSIAGVVSHHDPMPEGDAREVGFLLEETERELAEVHEDLRRLERAEDREARKGGRA